MRHEDPSFSCGFDTYNRQDGVLDCQQPMWELQLGADAALGRSSVTVEAW